MKKGYDSHGEYLDFRFGSEAIYSTVEVHHFLQGEMRVGNFGGQVDTFAINPSCPASQVSTQYYEF